MAASAAAGVMVAAGTCMQICKMYDRIRNDRQTLQRSYDAEEGNAFENATELSQVLSCLITGIYLRCRCPEQEQEQRPYFHNIEQHWTHWGYEVVGFDNLAGTYDEVDDDRRRIGDLAGNREDKYVRAVLFKRSGSQATSVQAPSVQAPPLFWGRVEGAPDQPIRVELPKYVFAIRGTILPRHRDIISNIHIALEVLHENEGSIVKRLLRAITRKYNPHDICVTGHSLGAALALYATRSLAIEDGVVINPHLFNPPYLTVGRLASKAMRGVLNGVGDVGDELIHVIGGGNTGSIRATTDWVADTCSYAARGVSRVVRKITIPSENAKVMKEEFEKLCRQPRYVPNLYLNPEDTISNEYIKHFGRDYAVHFSEYSEVIQLFMPAKSVHIIPAAILYINHWGEGPEGAHKLHQWFRFRHVNLTVERRDWRS